MKKKQIIILIISLVAVVGVLTANYFYYENRKDDYLECVGEEKYSNYEETLTFRFMYGTLYKYTRNEIITSDNVDEDIKVFKKIKDEAPNYEFFTYDVKSSKNKIYVKTEIEAFFTQEFYDDYMKEKDIVFKDSMDEVKKELESQNYTCKKYRK